MCYSCLVWFQFMEFVDDMVLLVYWGLCIVEVVFQGGDDFLFVLEQYLVVCWRYDCIVVFDYIGLVSYVC